MNSAQFLACPSTKGTKTMTPLHTRHRWAHCLLPAGVHQAPVCAVTPLRDLQPAHGLGLVASLGSSLCQPPSCADVRPGAQIAAGTSAGVYLVQLKHCCCCCWTSFWCTALELQWSVVCLSSSVSGVYGEREKVSVCVCVWWAVGLRWVVCVCGELCLAALRMTECEAWPGVMCLCRTCAWQLWG